MKEVKQPEYRPAQAAAPALPTFSLLEEFKENNVGSIMDDLEDLDADIKQNTYYYEPTPPKQK